MKTQTKYHFLLHKESSGYWAECIELDGCVTEGETLRETVNNTKEALNLYLNTNYKWEIEHLTHHRKNQKTTYYLKLIYAS